MAPSLPQSSSASRLTAGAAGAVRAYGFVSSLSLATR